MIRGFKVWQRQNMIQFNNEKNEQMKEWEDDRHQTHHNASTELKKDNDGEYVNMELLSPSHKMTYKWI